MDGLLSLLQPQALLVTARGAPPDDVRPTPTASPQARSLAGERLARLRLAGAERVGPVTFHELLLRFGSAAAALAALPELAAAAGLRRPPAVPAAREIAAEADALARLGACHLVIGDADYPLALAALPDAPPVLRVRGDVRLLGRSQIAIVGARNASAAGRRVAADLARELGAAGLIVVSGLARGIDTAAHLAAIETGTIAVLAGGVDVVYPPENEALHGKIAAQGLLLTEMPLGVVPQARHFPRRNRIISGLCAGVVVVEAALQSGSLITAQRAADQGREVFAVPGSPLDPRCRGSNRLLKDGAHLVECADDVLAELPLQPRHALPAAAAAIATGADPGAVSDRGPGPDGDTHHPPPDSPFDGVPASSATAERGRRTRFDWRRLFRNERPPPADSGADLPASAQVAAALQMEEAVINDRDSAASEPARSLNAPTISHPRQPQFEIDIRPQRSDSVEETASAELRGRILECLGPGPAPVDEIVRQCQVSAATVQAILLELELAGRLERHRGNAVSLL